jgi:hypothetical protein
MVLDLGVETKRQEGNVEDIGVDDVSEFVK